MAVTATRRIRIVAGDACLEAELRDTPTARAVWEALPFEAGANTWGEEIYFRIPVSLELEPEARDVVQVGDLGYWPAGQAFCVFFGPTPVSREGEIRPASAVNVFGRIVGDVASLKKVRDGDPVRVERIA